MTETQVISLIINVAALGGIVWGAVRFAVSKLATKDDLDSARRETKAEIQEIHTLAVETRDAAKETNGTAKRNHTRITGVEGFLQNQGYVPPPEA